MSDGLLRAMCGNNRGPALFEAEIVNCKGMSDVLLLAMHENNRGLVVCRKGSRSYMVGLRQRFRTGLAL